MVYRFRTNGRRFQLSSVIDKIRRWSLLWSSLNNVVVLKLGSKRSSKRHTRCGNNISANLTILLRVRADSGHAESVGIGARKFHVGHMSFCRFSPVVFFGQEMFVVGVAFRGKQIEESSSYPMLLFDSISMLFDPLSRNYHDKN